jgi:hypothetical protein
MRVYLPRPDLDWVPLRLSMTSELDGRKHLQWWTEDLSIELMPEAFRLIRAAEQVYIFRINNSLEPRRDDQHMRLLERKAGKELIHLLGHRGDWLEGGYAVPVEPAPDVGFIFRRDKSEVVLFFCTVTAEGTVSGRHTAGMLDRKRYSQFEEWKRRYAQQELPTR